jgi:PAS domain S-box-containing protein
MHSSVSKAGREELQHQAARVTRPAGMMLTALLVALSYYLGSKVGFAIRFPSIPTSIVWPPNSILMAALMLTPARRWWVYLLAALSAHILIQSGAAVPLPTMLLLFLTNAGEAALGAYAVRRLCGGTPRFGYLRDVVIFFIFAVCAAPFVTSFLDAAVVVLTKWGDNYSLVWYARFNSNVLTVLMLVPAVVVWAANGRNWLREVTPRRLAEGFLLALGLWVACAVAYSESAFGPSLAPALLYAPLPFLMWAALRFGAGGVSTSLLAVLLISVLYAIVGRGPFTSHSPAEDIVGLQLFLIAISVPIMLLAAVTEERRRAAEALSRSEEFNRQIVESSSECIKILNLKGDLLYMSPKGQELLGIDDLHPYLNTSWIELWGDEGREMARDAISRAKAGKIGSFQSFGQTMRGERKWWDTAVTPIRDASGNIEQLLAVSRDITEQRQAEDALRESEARFRTLSESAPVLIWVNGPEGCEYVNHQYLEFLGVEEAEVRGYGWARFLHAEDHAAYLGAFNVAADHRTMFEAQCRLLRHDGEYRWMKSLAMPRLSPSGDMLGYVGTTTDITDIRQAQDALRESESRLRLAQQAARVGTWELDVATGTSVWSEMIWHLIGLEPGDGASSFEIFMEFIHPEDRESFRRTVRDALADGEEYENEFRIVRRDGEVLYLSSKGRVIRSAAGQPERMLGVSIDITEHKRTEEALRESEERFRTMANNAPVVIWVTESDGSCSFLSQTWQDLTGQDLEAGLGFGWTECVHPEDHDHALNAYLAANERREAFRLDYRLRGKDGAYLWAIDSGAPRFNSQGEFLGYIGSVIDITERKRAEQSLEQLTGRLLQLQDEERRRIARELHDTTAQNLLAIVINLETLVQKASTLPKDFVEAVSESQLLCEQTQAEIRTLSYLLHPPMLDEAGLILALEWFVDGFSRRSGIHVDFNAPPEFRRLPSQMETALFRIVQESLANIYRHSGSRTAEVGLERGEGQVCLRVTDHGRGIAATGNGGGATAQRAETLGVGISGMRERLRQLGGRLEVRSDKTGTSVTAVLPLEKGRGNGAHPAG